MTKFISPISPSGHLARVKFITLLREPFARLLSQFRHDKYYTPRVFKDCGSLGILVQHGTSCIQSGAVFVLEYMVELSCLVALRLVCCQASQLIVIKIFKL